MLMEVLEGIRLDTDLVHSEEELIMTATGHSSCPACNTALTINLTAQSINLEPIIELVNVKIEDDDENYTTSLHPSSKSLTEEEMESLGMKLDQLNTSSSSLNTTMLSQQSIQLEYMQLFSKNTHNIKTREDLEELQNCRVGLHGKIKAAVSLIGDDLMSKWLAANPNNFCPQRKLKEEAAATFIDCFPFLVDVLEVDNKNEAAAVIYLYEKGKQSGYLHNFIENMQNTERRRKRRQEKQSNGDEEGDGEQQNGKRTRGGRSYKRPRVRVVFENVPTDVSLNVNVLTSPNRF